MLAFPCWGKKKNMFTSPCWAQSWRPTFHTSLPSLTRLGNFERNSKPCPNRTNVLVPSEGRGEEPVCWAGGSQEHLSLSSLPKLCKHFSFFSDYNKYIFANHSLDTQMGKQGSKVSLRHRGVSWGGKQEVVPSVFTHSSKDNPLRECQGLSVLLN